MNNKITLKSGLVIMPDNSYKTAHGKQFNVYFVHSNGDIIGSDDLKQVFIVSSRDADRYFKSVWNEAPVVDWSKMAAWFKFAALDHNSRWWAYTQKPTCGDFYWIAVGNESAVEIPAGFAPQFKGDWKDSLAERP